MWKTGHSLIKSKMKETHAPLAGEMSGHVFFADGYYGFDDALYAAVRLIAASARLGKSVTELKSAMPAMLNTPELRFQVDESRKFAAIDEVKQRLSGTDADVNDTDGVRVTTPDGWWLLRASNTQDVLVARAESGTARPRLLICLRMSRYASPGVGRLRRGRLRTPPLTHPPPGLTFPPVPEGRQNVAHPFKGGSRITNNPLRSPVGTTEQNRRGWPIDLPYF
jgi:hypothetical protein